MTGGGKGHHSRHRRPGLIKELEGNRARLGKAKIKPDPRGIGRPRLPAHLTAEEQELWRDVVASLPVGLLTQADEQALERMAMAWAEFRETKEMIRKTGKMVQSPQGPIRNPLYIVRDRAERGMHMAGEVLGLSPVSRARLTTIDTPEDDPMALLLGPDDDPNGAWSTLAEDEAMNDYDPAIDAAGSYDAAIAAKQKRGDQGYPLKWPADAVQRVSIKTLVPYQTNARTHSAGQIDQIAASIKQWGWTVPVLVDVSNTVIAGHGRLEAAKLLGLDTVPVMVAKGWTQRQIKAYRLADNQLALNAAWDVKLLAAELGELTDMAELISFSDDELLRILGGRDLDGYPALPDGDKTPFQQMTFTLHDDQVELVEAALDAAKAMGMFVDSPNENGNGNALARICETFLDAKR